MRILHLLSQTELTGSEVYAETLAQDQVSRGHEIFVLSDHLHRPFPGTTARMSVSTNSFWTRMANIRTLVAYLREHRIDVIHCHSRAACRHAHWASRFTQTPVVTTLHGFQHVSFSKKLFNIYGDTVIAVCEKISTQLREDFGVDPASVKVLRNPIELSDPSTQIPDSERLTIALIGRASGPKGRRLQELFSSEAAGWLGISPHLRVELILPGLSPAAKSSLEHKIPAHLRDRIFIEATHQPLPAVFTKAKIVVASGRIAVEAFAAGCEVVALGEARLEGHLSEENLPHQLANNFGDVGNEEALDPPAVSHEIRKVWREPLSLRARQKVRDILAREFSKSLIAEQIEEIYRGARLLKVAPSLPVLMYHRVPLAEIPTQHRIFVTKDNFEKHLWFFQARGLTTLNFEDLSDFWFERRPLSEFPERPVMLTFDDGYEDNLQNAQPLLEKYHHKATIFLLADPSIVQNNWDSEPGVAPAALMTLEQKRQLKPETFAVGSHGLQHLKLPELPDDQILQQMTESKARLETDLGRPIHAFAYPFGVLDERLPGLAKKAGYDFALNTDLGAERWVDNRFSFFRVNIFPEESWFSLWRKTSTWYRRRYFKKRGR